jgi:hypothetical protein
MNGVGGDRRRGASVWSDLAAQAEKQKRLLGIKPVGSQLSAKGLQIGSPARFAFDHAFGATPVTAMTHIAIQEKPDAKALDWMQSVSDDQYRK